MAGIMNKISETLHMGGNKEEAEEHKGPEGYHVVEGHKASEGYHGGEEHKEGMVEKIKDKIHGGDHEGSGGEKKKEKKEKKDKKEKKEHGGDHSSSSDSDSD